MANFDINVFSYSNSKNYGWGERKAFSEDDIEQIRTDHKPGKMPKVAVPSPYARFELMQKAFGNVAKNGDSADLRDRQLVSQALDVFQLIFEGTNLGKLDVVEWHLDGATSNLISMGENIKEKRPGLWLYGKTLKDYASRESYGLRDSDQLNGETTLYLLRHNEDVLGMTCPTSVFMPTPNYNDYIWNEYEIEGGIPVFSITRDLYERPKDFIIHLYAWFEGIIQENNKKVPECLEFFWNYINKQKEILSRINQDVYDDIKDSKTLDSYSIAEINGKELSVLGFPIYKIQKASISKSIKEKSDLTIKSTLKPGTRPLVLSNNISNTKWIYTSDTTYWDSKNSNLDYSERSLWQTEYKCRETLPNGIDYDEGYISEHDFLSDQLWKLPYNLDEEKFEKIRISDEPDGCSFLAPVTPLYFEFFTQEDLKKALQLQVKNNSNGEIVCVTAILDIPVKGGTVKFKKVYWPSDSMSEVMSDNLSTESEAKGFIVETPLALSIFPFIRFNDPEMNDYALQLVRNPFNEIKMEFEMSLLSLLNNQYICFDSENRNKLRKCRRREENGQATIQSYSLQGKNFDIIKFDLVAENFKSTAFLFPNWEEYKPGNKGLTFAFDFGTTNTYVAVGSEDGYREELNLPMSLLACTSSGNPGEKADQLFQISCQSYIRQEMLPYSRKDNPFPIASVLSIPKADHNGGRGNPDSFKIPFLRNSIPFVYGFEDYGSAHNDILGNLKWLLGLKKREDEADLQKHVPAFINELMMIARAYAIEKGADLSKSKIVWTYPLSMPEGERDDLQEIWEEAYKQYFNKSPKSGDNPDIVSLPESVAPLLSHGADVEEIGLSIDVGGGTCDVVIYDRQESDWKISSFRLGGESIFGIDKTAEEVPMIAKALKEIKERLKQCQHENPSYQYLLDQTIKNLPSEKSKVSEVTRSLFGLCDLETISALELNDLVSFNEWLQEHDEYHHIFLYYYAAIIYYISRMMVFAEYEYAPENVYFSGAGSKMLNVISQGKKRVLRNLTTEMFRHFAPELDVDEIGITMEKEPKKVTAYGALSDSRQKKKFTDFSKAAKCELKYFMINGYDDIKKLTFGELKERVDGCVESFKCYNDAFESFVDKYADDFDINKECVSIFLNSIKRKGEWNGRKIRNTILNGCGELDDTDKYPDAPFFAGIKNLIFKEITRNDDDDD